MATGNMPFKPIARYEYINFDVTDFYELLPDSSSFLPVRNLELWQALSMSHRTITLPAHTKDCLCLQFDLIPCVLSVHVIGMKGKAFRI